MCTFSIAHFTVVNGNKSQKSFLNSFYISIYIILWVLYLWWKETWSPPNWLSNLYLADSSPFRLWSKCFYIYYARYFLHRLGICSFIRVQNRNCSGAQTKYCNCMCSRGGASGGCYRSWIADHVNINFWWYYHVCKC